MLERNFSPDRAADMSADDNDKKFVNLLLAASSLIAADLDQVGFVQALLTVLLPTNFFFVFLYYTDLGALTFFLAAYWVIAISTPFASLPGIPSTDQHGSFTKNGLTANYNLHRCACMKL